MRLTTLTTCIAAAIPLFGCGSISLTADPLGGGKCVPLDANDPNDALLIAYYKQAGDESRTGLRLLSGGRAPFVVNTTAIDSAFTGAPSWQLPHASNNRSLTPEAKDQLSRALLVQDVTSFGEPDVTDSAKSAAAVLWSHLSAVVPTAAQSERVLGSTQPSSSSNLSLAKLSARDHWETDVSEAVQTGGDEALVTLTRDEAVKARSAFESSSESERAAAAALAVQRQQEASAASFLGAYLKAYFRSGHVLQANLQTTEITDAAMAAIAAKTSLTPDQKTAVQDELTSQLQKLCNKDSSGTDCLLTSSLGSDKFTSRSGATYQFQGVTLALGYSGSVQATWDYPKGKDFGPALARVLMEAAFDSRLPYVPAAATSTACSVKGLYPPERCMSSDTLSKAPGLQDAVSAVDEKANRADGVTSVATATLIRSFGIVALNNEAAATTVENLAAAVARKVTERAAWEQTYTQMCKPASMSVAAPGAIKVSK